MKPTTLPPTDKEFARELAFIEATKDWAKDVDALLEKIAKDDQEFLEKISQPGYWDIGNFELSMNRKNQRR